MHIFALLAHVVILAIFSNEKRSINERSITESSCVVSRLRSPISSSTAFQSPWSTLSLNCVTAGLSSWNPDSASSSLADFLNIRGFMYKWNCDWFRAQSTEAFSFCSSRSGRIATITKLSKLDRHIHKTQRVDLLVTKALERLHHQSYQLQATESRRCGIIRVDTIDMHRH